MSGITRYGYRDAISGFFEFPTENARRVLPKGFEPVEVHHGTSILAVTVFDFHESEVGEYGEVVYAVIVPPLVRDTRLPKSAFFPQDGDPSNVEMQYWTNSAANGTR